MLANRAIHISSWFLARIVTVGISHGVIDVFDHQRLSAVTVICPHLPWDGLVASFSDIPALLIKPLKDDPADQVLPAGMFRIFA